jgi:hypothetical protein
MSRYVELKEKSLYLTLDGLTSIMAFKKQLEIPYSAIKTVDTKLPDLPFLWKLAGVKLGEIQEGHFKRNGEYYFFSLEHSDRIIVLELEDFKIGSHPYRLVAFEVENPEELKTHILSHLK